eukprot:1001719-Amphidinium_carterae.1
MEAAEDPPGRATFSGRVLKSDMSICWMHSWVLPFLLLPFVWLWHFKHARVAAPTSQKEI